MDTLSFYSRALILGSLVLASVLPQAVAAETDSNKAETDVRIEELPLINSGQTLKQNLDIIPPKALQYRSHSTIRAQAISQISHYFDSDITSNVLQLDMTGPYAALILDGSEEVWALSKVSGPRGDMLLKTDTGRIMLRLTDLGAATLYRNEASLGEPVTIGQTAAFIAPMGVRSDVRLNRESALIHLAPFMSDETKLSFAPGADNDPDLLRSALANLKQALKVMGDKRPLLGHIEFQTAARPSAHFDGHAFIIALTPGQGFAGRPSSEFMIRALSFPQKPS